MNDIAPMSNDITALAQQAEEVLRSGRAVILPTDTVYGLATLPQYVSLLFKLKQRPADKAVAVLVASPADAATLFRPAPAARLLMDAFWPGALTIVQDGTGVRCPDHPLVRAVADRAGPIATSSANLSGQPTPTTAAAAAAAFPAVDLVVDGGICDGAPSTVVEVNSDGVHILREGAVAASEILRVVATDTGGSAR